MPLLSERLIYPALSAKLTILLALGVALIAHSPGKDSMNPKLADEPGFTVIGIETRTSNAKEMTPDGEIGKTWARFLKDNLATQIPDKADTTLIALYTDYALAFEIAAVILLVAIVSAIALTLRRRKDSRYQDPSMQVKARREERVRLVSMPAEKER